MFSDIFCRITRVRNIAHPRNLGKLFIYNSSTIFNFLTQFIKWWAILFLTCVIIKLTCVTWKPQIELGGGVLLFLILFCPRLLLPQQAPATRSRTKAPSAPTISSEKICCATNWLFLPSFPPSYQTGLIWGSKLQRQICCTSARLCFRSKLPRV